jgi:hypothetical protein
VQVFSAASAGACPKSPDSAGKTDSSFGLRQLRLLPFPVRIALDDELVGGVLEAVDGSLSPEGIGHGRQPFLSVDRQNRTVHESRDRTVLDEAGKTR